MNELQNACIIQARMDSTRLPGKSLIEVYEGFSLLEIIFSRIKKAKNIDIIILATSYKKNCDPLADLAGRMDVSVVRGSETDVLDRFAKAIDIYHPESIVRVCADNPLVSPEEIDRLVEFYRKEDLDYATNSARQCGLPDGLGSEIVKASVLKKISDSTEVQKYREHVTLYIIEHKEKFRVGQLHALPNLFFPEARLDIDTQKDLENMKLFLSQLPREKAPFWSSQDIVNLSKQLLPTMKDCVS